MALAPASPAPAHKPLAPRENTRAVLHNPDMGWVLYENHPLDPRPNGSGTLTTLPGESFAGCDHVAVMFAWSDVELESGRYDWSRVDHACAHWQRLGKSIQLRLSTEPLFGWSLLNPPSGLGIPTWLLDQIPATHKQQRHDGSHSGWHVDANHPLYQKHLRRFLTETNRHCATLGQPGLIDLRGFGRWGEWHSGYRYASLADKRQALDQVLNIWCEAFPGKHLALSYSFDPDGPAALHAGPANRYDASSTSAYDEYLRYSAFDLALGKPGITLRRDGVGGAVHSNERKLCEHAYRSLMMAPLMSEFICGYAQAKKGGNAHLEWMLEDALSLHPNYISLLGYGARDALLFMHEHPELVASGLRRMGYRLVPLTITLPPSISPQDTVAVSMQWINRGCGRALKDFHLQFRFIPTDRHAPVAITRAAPLPTSRWLHNDVHHLNLTLPPLNHTYTGTATVQLSLVDPTTQRRIQLPLNGANPDAWYPIGSIHLQ